MWFESGDSFLGVLSNICMFKQLVLENVLTWEGAISYLRALTWWQRTGHADDPRKSALFLLSGYRKEAQQPRHTITNRHGREIRLGTSTLGATKFTKRISIRQHDHKHCWASPAWTIKQIICACASELSFVSPQTCPCRVTSNLLVRALRKPPTFPAWFNRSSVFSSTSEVWNQLPVGNGVGGAAEFMICSCSNCLAHYTSVHRHTHSHTLHVKTLRLWQHANPPESKLGWS